MPNVPHLITRFVPRAEGGAGFTRGTGTAVNTGPTSRRKGFTSEVTKGEDKKNVAREKERVGRKRKRGRGVYITRVRELYVTGRALARAPKLGGL